MAAEIQIVDGAEARVETGTGVIDKLDRRERNIGVTIRSDNRAVREPVTGWLDSMGLGDGAHPQLTEGLRVEYRIHVRRKNGVDPSRPFAELGKREKVRDMVILRPIAPVSSSTDAATPAGSSSDTPGASPVAAPRTAEPSSPPALADDDLDDVDVVRFTHLAGVLVQRGASDVALAAQFAPVDVAERLTKAHGVLSAIAVDLMGETT